MLNPHTAAQRLQEFSTEQPQQKQCARIRTLPEAFRIAALALLGLKPDETPFVTADYSDYLSRRKQQDAEQMAQEAAFRLLDALPLPEREALFAALLPGLASLLACWWHTDGPTLYQAGYNRRPFRLQPSSGGGTPSDETRHERRAVLRQFLANVSAYQEMPISWFAAWVPYLGAHNADTFGKLCAVAIDRGGSEDDAVFNVLLASGRGEHEVGAMGRHVVRGLLCASRSDGWEFVEKLLLAAQRQEGLRQNILEAVDEARPEAFRRMLQVIRENDLFRFSATVRAADTWFGMNWVAYDKLSVKQANAATETVETFLRDPAGRDAALAEAADGQTVYLALWSIAFHDARAALRAALPLFCDPRIERRYAALHLLTELRLGEARPAILSTFDDPDLRVAQKAFAASNWYESPAAPGSSAETLAASLAEQEAGLTDALDIAEPGTPLADFLGGIKQAISSAVAAIAGSEKAGKAEDAPTGQEADDRFERLARNISRFPARAKSLEPVIWEWDVLSAHAETLADRLPSVLGSRPVERLFPFLPLMGSHGRSQVARIIGERPDKTAEMRAVLFGLVGDSASYVRDSAFQAIQKFDLVDSEAERIEGLLTRKAADLRKSALSLLLKRGDHKAIESGERLTASRDANQRVAGLDLLTQLVEKKRSPDQARALVVRFAQARAGKLTSAEKAMLEPLTNAQHEKPTLENALGLMDDARRTVAPRPAERSRFVYVTESAPAIVAGLNEFAQRHKELPVGGKNYNDDAVETLLGNVTYPWQFAQPDDSLTLDADAKRLPVYEQLTAWWESRPDRLRDADGWELVRVQTALAARAQDTYGQKTSKEVWTRIEPLFGNVPPPQTVTPALIAWLVRLYPPQGDLVDFYLDAAETVLARIAGFEDENGRHGWRTNSRILAYLQAARNHRQQNPDGWTSEQIARLWHLLRCVDQSSPQIKARQRIATTEEIAAALRVGAANEHDVYDHLLARTTDAQYGRFNDLQSLSSRKSLPIFDKTPGLRPIVDNCRKRILEVELRRGDTETAASEPARALRYSGGRDVLLQLVAALGKDTFARGYSYYGQTNRSNVFSHLIRATFPGEADTPEAFAQAAEAANIGEKRLIETAVYAPQWAKHVEAALGWDGFVQAVWWLHAHTKDNSWSVDAEIKEAWAAEIADKTPLTAADLTEGAVDVAWFKRVYQALGEARWKQIDDATKYASSAGGHKRAQLFADAMLGRLNLDELVTRIQDKRHQDSLRALGLVPLAQNDREAFAADLLRRYQTMQEFVRTSKQFGAQRQESEKLAARIGMENLARTAGYADPNRLAWAMEAAAVADLKNGAVVTKTAGEVSVTLGINGPGLPELTVVKKNKTLTNIPPAVKKDPDVAALVARRTEIARQVSRMRESLEAAMCRGDIFSGAELASLLEHPVLRPLLRNLVFIEAEGKEPVLGYPIGDDRLQDTDGAACAISADTPLRIAHPYDLLHTGRWERWQKECFLRERVQPFKQVFRELYVVTAAEKAEKADATRSLHYAGHQVNPKQALALFNKRGWVGGGEYDYDSDGPRKTFHEAGYSVSVGFLGGTFSPADVEGATIEEVRFSRKGDWRPVPLEAVPPRVFSEAMRDLDLVVSVAHAGGVDPEASQSTVEMRAALIREAMGLLKIENVRFQQSHAIVDGTLATYNVHLGSAIVHRQPGGYLCIVPVHGQHRGRLFLPFVDDDPRTAEVVSKVLLLARDSQIKDPTILEQILAVK